MGARALKAAALHCRRPHSATHSASPNADAWTLNSGSVRGGSPLRTAKSQPQRGVGGLRIDICMTWLIRNEIIDSSFLPDHSFRRHT